TNVTDGLSMKAGRTSVRGIAFDGGSGVKSIEISAARATLLPVEPSQTTKARKPARHLEPEVHAQRDSDLQSDSRVKALSIVAALAVVPLFAVAATPAPHPAAKAKPTREDTFEQPLVHASPDRGAH
ncbi:MAG: hypothetical protein M3R30_06850, partial [Candidatus Eremiobacteraeota bacterium]|nr:hypothetical protein [Candidatus Eremiobacteraeota bacterium]